jgi:hypothetical protein
LVGSEDEMSDPLWLDQLAGELEDKFSLYCFEEGRDVVRAVLDFIEHQPRQITKAMVGAAAEVIRRETMYDQEEPALMIARYAIEAAEKARTRDD